MLFEGFLNGPVLPAQHDLGLLQIVFRTYVDILDVPTLLIYH